MDHMHEASFCMLALIAEPSRNFLGTVKSGGVVSPAPRWCLDALVHLKVWTDFAMASKKTLRSSGSSESCHVEPSGHVQEVDVVGLHPMSMSMAIVEVMKPVTWCHRRWEGSLAIKGRW